jgi:Uncharacterised nucleotidyltransferase
MSQPSALPVLVQLLRAPACVASWELGQWDLMLRQAVSANLTASVYARLDETGLLDAAPAQARRHLDWAHRLALRHGRAVRWEVRQIADALASLGMPLLLLKGAAYVMADLEAGQGRLFSDIDILVPKERINEVESLLLLRGWMSGHHDPYDQRYYRQWMHELPPMEHVKRETMIDVHHAILPPTARAHPDSRLLRAAAVTLDTQACALPLQTLAPVDMVLHSATHLFFDGEFDHGLRDIVDLDRLLRRFGADPAFWSALAPRALELGLQRPLFYALRYVVWLLDTPVPAAAIEAAAGAGRPNPVLLGLMDSLFKRALLPTHPSCGGRASAMAHFCLYVRGNWLRMPPVMLARHLFHKAFISPKTVPGA